MPRLRVRSVAPPPASRLAERYPGSDLLDAFAIVVPSGGAGDLATLSTRALADPAPWFPILLGLRDAVVRRFGIRTSREIRADLVRRGADRIDFFPVLSHSDEEIVLGENDRYLDVRVSLMLRSAAPEGSQEFVVTTVVHCHNRLGRAYLAAIATGHRIVVRTALRRTVAGRVHPPP